MYFLLNCIPMIWGNSGTMEFRLHSPTLNIHKILNWLYICNAIMAYVEKHKDELANWGDLKDVNLNSIFADVYEPELAGILNCYVQWRKDYMVDMDPTGEKELREDLLTPPHSVLQ